MEEDLRFPAVSGKFYPLDPVQLSDLILENLGKKPSKESSKSKLKGLIVPHSGYQFCIEVYAAAYAEIQNKVVDEVFILGFSSFHQIKEVAFTNYKFWQTPLGKVEQSHRISQIVMSDDATAKDIFRFNNNAHNGEHSIELQLPMLQESVSGDYRIIPIACGEVSPRLIAKALDKHIDPDDLIIAVSELSHGFPNEYATEVDKHMIDNILSMSLDKVEGEGADASNKVGLLTLMNIAKFKGWKPKLLTYMTSAQTYPEVNSVSGYVAIGFYE